MPQSIECRRAQYLIGERLPPFGEVQVAGDDGGAALVALGNEVVEHLIVGLAHWLEAEVVDDDQRCLHQVLEPPLEAVGGPRCVQGAQELALGGEQHVVALPHRAVTDGLCTVAFTGATGGQGPGSAGFAT